MTGDYDRVRPPTSDGPPIIVPLIDSRCADPSFAGAEVAAIARVNELLPAPAAVLTVGSMVGWRQLAAEGMGRLTDSDPHRLIPGLDRRMTVRAWVISSGGTARREGPVWYNIPETALDECLLELVGLAERAGDPPATARLAVLLQSFVRAEVTVLATVAGGDGPVLLRSCWGIAEDLGNGLWQDEVVLAGADLAVEQERVVHKPTATSAADGGTRVVPVEPELRGKPALPVPQARMLAATCRAAAYRLGASARFELAIVDGARYLLSCQAPVD